MQLPSYSLGAAWAFLREAQDQALVLSSVGRVVTIDIGEPDNLHPQNKKEVGRRLALHALAKYYGIVVEHSGPVYDGVARENNELRVRFRHAAGLMTKDPSLSGFLIAGPDRNFTPARARIEGQTVVVSSPVILTPVATRYAWAPAPPAPLYNADGLPAAPFRSDNWEE